MRAIFTFASRRTLAPVLISAALVAPLARAQAPSPPAPTGADAAVTPAAPAQSRRRIAQAMAALGGEVDEARQAKDIVRLNCTLGKQDRGQQAVELTRVEVGVVADDRAASSSRVLAAAKLEALADRLEQLVEESRSDCNPEGADDRLDVTKTRAAEPPTIPLRDPAAVAVRPIPAAPPILDPDWLPTTSGVQ